MIDWLLCRVGLHDWQRLFADKWTGGPRVVGRRCARCPAERMFKRARVQ